LTQITGYPFTSADFHRDPYPFYARLRQEAPVYPTTLPNGSQVFLVTRYADVLAASKDPRLVKDINHARGQNWTMPAEDNHSPLGILAQMNNANMLRADPPQHTRLRGLVQEAFTPRYVSQLRSHIQEIADRLLDSVHPQGAMDLISDFAFPLPITVICEMLGAPLVDVAQFRRWSAAFIDSGVMSSDNPPLLPEMLEALAYMRELVAQRSTHPRDDLISRLIHVDQSGDHLNSVELLSTALLLLIAGHETTVNLIGNGMLALLLNPSEHSRLRQEPTQIKSAVEELLRFANPVHMVNRFAAEDLSIAGVSIPRGSHLILLVAAANHDPAYYAHPEQLDLAQSDQKHLAFGQGLHYCIGAPLARLEGEIAFTTLLTRLPALRLDVSVEQLAWRPGVGLRGLYALPVRF
jgi:cytochrome P450